ncbi:hypothetical protein LPW11_01980 [Geomonas sp. RF6]|uniref:hypothetical protein n=1 Tax=Geomonas sp. RF6 TaxID=2897342 RepID=UPI001E2890BF|nr:hypothetical protein [Geomonas sp. RF6]UFS70966.1 hypothetical protein LPW11_01980 [Geomonas sp. RF6]
MIRLNCFGVRINRGGRILLLSTSIAISSQAVFAGGEAGSTATVFNRRFLAKIQPMMPYLQLSAMIGTPGAKVADQRYRWNGGRNSHLEVTLAAGKIVDATVTSPKNEKISLLEKRRRGRVGQE